MPSRSLEGLVSLACWCLRGEGKEMTERVDLEAIWKETIRRIENDELTPEEKRLGDAFARLVGVTLEYMDSGPKMSDLLKALNEGKDTCDGK